jgi:hypothetical protein
MYAKLSFPPSTLPAEIVRDITRVLISSNGAGGATLGACEFVNAVDSSISDTEASTWELAEGTLGTGAATANDRYILKSPHAQAGKYKVVELGANGSTTNMWNNLWSGATLMPILDYGEATQRLLGGYNSTNGTYVKMNTLVGTIHVVATSKCLLLFGDSNAADMANHKMIFILESAVTTTSAYRDLAPYLFMSFHDVQNSHGTSYNDNYDLGGPTTGTSSFATGGVHISGIDMWDFVNNVKARAVQWVFNSSYSSVSDVWYQIKSRNDNGTALGLDTLQSGYMNGGGFGCSEIWPPYDGALHGLDRRAIDSSGNPALPLYPLSIRDPMTFNEWFDFSATNIYKTNGDQGSFGDTATISGTEYFYIPLQSCGAFMIRKV